MANNMIECLVADSAAFLKNAQLQQMGNRIFTVEDVVNEIRDSATRRSLAVLPYKIEFREPSTESLKIVSDFAKKTGDFPSLSAVDVKVMALTYQLEKEFCNNEHIRNEPVNKIERVRGGGITNIKPEHGFFFDTKSDSTKDDKSAEIGKEINGKRNGDPLDNDCKTEKDYVATDKKEIPKEMVMENEELHNKDGDDMVVDEDQETKVDRINGDGYNDYSKGDIDINVTDTTEDKNGDDSDFVDDNGDCDDDDDDGGGWITPSNIGKVKKEMGLHDVDQNENDAKCACLTTDFAMQNVLLQLGLHVISVDGMMIRQARSYILKCHGCAKETTEMERVFCKHCGNKTLKKVSVTVNSDGSLTYHYPKKMRPLNIRGTKYSIPLPKAGRHASNVILAEDQKQATHRLPKAKDTANALDLDYVARSSPFTYKDVTSKAFKKGFHLKENSRRNPNEGRKTKSKRK